MSGGEHEYFYFKLQTYLEEYGHHFLKTQNRRELLKILEPLPKVLRSIEWEESGDISEKESEEKINEFLTGL
jgi:hypothetical protein